MEQISGTSSLQKIQQLAESDSSVKTVMEALSKRRRFRSKTDLYHFRDQIKKFTGSEMNSETIINTFKELQSAGVGRLILKRERGQKSPARPRFEWRYSLKDVARAAGFGEPLTNEPKEIAKKRGRPRKEKAATDSPKAKRGRPRKIQAAGAKEVQFMNARVAVVKIRPNVEVRLEFPKSITKAEAKKVAALISSVG
jgi:hypothetical protein